MYTEYLAEFWYSATSLENSKVSFSILTGGIFGEVGVNTSRNAIGAYYLAHFSEYVAPPSIDIVKQWFSTIGYGERHKAWSSTWTQESSLKQTFVSNKEATKGGFSKAPTGSKTGHPKKKKESSLGMDSNPSQPIVSTLVDPGMYKEDQQATGGPTSLGVTSEARALNSVVVSVSTAEADLENSAPNDFIPQQHGINEGTKNNSYDHSFAGTDPHVLADLTQSVSEGLDTVLTQPLTRKGASSIARQDEEEEAFGVIKLKDLEKLELTNQILILQSQKHKLELEMNKVEAEVALLKDQPSFPNVEQLKKRCPTSEFHFHKGLKQGDPLSLFLFILVMESLHLSFSRVLEAGKWDTSNIKMIVNVLNCFYMASGPKINLLKSKLTRIGVSKEDIDLAASTVGCSTFSPPFHYLGVKKLKTLSIGGRLTLLKFVLIAIPIFHMSLFKVPAGILKDLESIRMNFFNGTNKSERKMVWIGWDNILASNKSGGLFISNLYATNCSLLFKWVWHFLTQESSLWYRFITAIYGTMGAAMDVQKPTNKGFIWYDLFHALSTLNKQGVDLLAFMRRKLGNGDRTLFWEDIWLGEVALNFAYPRIFALELRKDCNVAEKMRQSSLDLSFRRLPRGARGLEIPTILFPSCNESVESSVHSFFSCSLSRQVMFKIGLRKGSISLAEDRVAGFTKESDTLGDIYQTIFESSGWLSVDAVTYGFYIFNKHLMS
nr:hypothetical protein [Tanacetum cinerariifolium]